MFIRIILADLGEAYKKSINNRIKALLGSLFPSGLTRNENGTFDHKISPLYQYIQDNSFDTALNEQSEPNGYFHPARGGQAQGSFGKI
ncbi:hypothetical protein HYU95_04725 [Candidatus Daviesbacteria bacterium]|nr:hypothetical protein [Candidatus Daviesbacteria bacterium]